MRRLVIILLAIPLLMVVLFVWFTKGERVSTAVVLSDGREIVIRDVVRSGTPVSSDKPWMKLARRVLPKPLQGRLPGTSSAACSSGNPNHLLVYFEGSSVPWQCLVPVDDDGFRYPISAGSCSIGLATGETLYGVFLPAFPRRQRTFRVEFLNDERKVIARARLRNPLLPLNEQAWQTQSLPVTLTNGELALTLVTVLERTNAWGSQLAPLWDQRAFDPRWEATRMSTVCITDPIGNEGIFLSRKERAWQLTTSVHRQRFEDFGPTEKIGVSNLTVPAPAEMLPLNVSLAGEKLQILVEGLYGPGTLYVTNGLQRSMTANWGGAGGTTTMGTTVVKIHSSSHPFVLVCVSGMADKDELLARCWDENGGSITTDFSRGDGYRVGGLRVFQIGLEPGGKVQSVSLELAVSRPKEFVFYINPKDIQPPR